MPGTAQNEVVVRFRSLGRGTSGGIVITLLIHGAIVGGILWSRRPRAEATEEARDLIVTELVRIGKPREKFWLPRISQPPRPKAPPAGIKVTEDPNAAASPKEAPRPENAEVSKDLRRALERARMLQAAAEEEPEEGSLTGLKEGTASHASEGDECATLVFNAIRRHWSAPAGLLGDAELEKLITEIRVAIDDEGGVRDPKVVKSSGNPVFDSSAVQAIQATGVIENLPATCKVRFKRGVRLAFEPRTLR